MTRKTTRRVPRPRVARQRQAATRPTSTRTRRRPGRRPRTISVRPNRNEVAEQMAAHAPFVSTVTALSEAQIAMMPPELAFQTGLYAPGRVATPYVMDGQAVPVRTAVGQGHASFSKDNITTSSQLIIFFYPVVGALVSPQVSGIAPIQFTDDTASFTGGSLSTNTTIALSDLYGLSTSFSDRILTYAVEFQAVVDVPDATRSGEVFIGSMSYDSMQGGITVSAMKDMATRIVSAKETNRYSNTIRVVNRPSLLTPGAGNISNLGSEQVGYMIFANYARPIGVSGLLAYNVEIKAYANYVYYPDGASPLLNSLVRPVFTSDKDPTSSQTRAAHIVSHLNGTGESATPQILESIMQVAGGVLKTIPGVSTVAKTINRVAGAIATASTYVMAEQNFGFPRVRDEINWMLWLKNRSATVFSKTYTQDVEDDLNQMADILENLLEALFEQDAEASAFGKFLTTLSTRLEITRKGHIHVYYLSNKWVPKSEVWQHWVQTQSGSVYEPEPAHRQDELDNLTGRLQFAVREHEESFLSGCAPLKKVATKEVVDQGFNPLTRPTRRPETNSKLPPS